jgi:hypothetical protein
MQTLAASTYFHHDVFLRFSLTAYAKEQTRGKPLAGRSG